VNPSSTTVLLGPASIDRYVDEAVERPGGGIVNVAYHLAQLEVPFQLITRIGDDRPKLFAPFLARYGIEPVDLLSVPGTTSSIDIRIAADRQPNMDNFIDGVWANLQLTDREVRSVATADHVHAVLVDPLAGEIQRLATGGRLDRPVVSADFLSFRRFSVDRFAEVMRSLDIAFIGWPGSAHDFEVRGIGEVAFDLGKLVVVTMGSQPVTVFDGRAGASVTSRFPVKPVEVTGTTIGCGDAFIANFLASFRGDGNIASAVSTACERAARVTAWPLPLPVDAYDPA
jgi:sugar/nucleoside kinase (ribokinase family)